MNINLKPFLTREPDGEIPDIHEFDSFDEVPEKSGAYIINSDGEKFKYPNGESRVMYIGTSVNLRKRLLTHHSMAVEMKSLTKAELNSGWYYSRYQYIRKFGGKVFWLTTRGTQDPKNLESEIIEAFYDRYLAIPVGNGAFSFKKQKK